MNSASVGVNLHLYAGVPLHASAGVTEECPAYVALKLGDDRARVTVFATRVQEVDRLAALVEQARAELLRVQSPPVSEDGQAVMPGVA